MRDGYVIQWWRSTIPSNSLASVYGLLAECAAGQRPRPRRRHRDRRLRRVQHRHRRQRHDRTNPRGRRRLRRPGRRAIEPISARARSRAGVPRRWSAGRDRRVPCLGLHLDAAQTARRPSGSARSRRHAVRGRRRRPHGRAGARHRRAGTAKPIYNYLADMPEMAAATLADPAAPDRCAHRRQLYELRCRAWLPVPVLVLHHHQRAGPQVALSHAGRHRRDRPRQRQAGHYEIFRHRRQLRPQPQLGADPRSPDRSARERGLQDPAAAAGRHAVPPHSGLHREGGARGLQRGVHRAGEHQSGIACRHQEAAEQDLGVSRDAPGLAQAEGHDLGRLHPRLPDRHAGDRSRATSRSSRRNSRSTSWSSSASRPCPARRTTRSCS